MSLLSHIFGCRHERYTWPRTRRSGYAQSTTVCCLECGREMLYDWSEMRVVNSAKQKLGGTICVLPTIQKY